MRRSRLATMVIVALSACIAGVHAAGGGSARASSQVRLVKIHYLAHGGVRRNAYVLLPSWYGPRNNPPLALVISPHGRGLNGRENARIWGDLPAIGSFIVVNPDGRGRRLPDYSWGYSGQIEDLARMPDIVTRTLRWVRVDRHQVYAFGGSMGGQETLLLVARHPRLLAGAAVFDAVTDLARQYHHFLRIECDRRCRRTWSGPIGKSLQSLARREIGGSPRKAPAAWASRSPLTYARRIAFSCVPLQLWWSNTDLIVIGQRQQSGRLFSEIRRLNPAAPVGAFVGQWRHSAEMKAKTRLPLALATFGLLPPLFDERTIRLHVDWPPQSAQCANATSFR